MTTKQLLVGIIVFTAVASTNGSGHAESTSGKDSGPTPSATQPVTPGISGTAASATDTLSTADQPKPSTPAKKDDNFYVPSSANLEWKGICVDKSQNLNGDIQESRSFLWVSDGQWSVGPAVSTQLVKYDMAKKQAGFNTSVGAGASFRFYRNIKLKDETGATIETVRISQIRRECRQSSFGGDRKSYLAAPMFSITPTLYATKPTTAGDLSVQPALLLGFFEDILNVGVGFNLTGPPGEKGSVFLLMSIGTGFSF